MDKNLYRALVFWQDKYAKEHNEVERLKKEFELAKRQSSVDDLIPRQAAIDAIMYGNTTPIVDRTRHVEALRKIPAVYLESKE